VASFSGESGTHFDPPMAGSMVSSLRYSPFPGSCAPGSENPRIRKGLLLKHIRTNAAGDASRDTTQGILLSQHLNLLDGSNRLALPVHVSGYSSRIAI
jgi:hypothetical protein